MGQLSKTARTAVLSAVWIAVLLALGVNALLSRHEPWSRRVDVWTIGGPSTPAHRLDGDYSSGDLVHFVDGGVYFLHFDGEQHVEKWDASAQRLVRVDAMPEEPSPPGVDVDDRCRIHTTLGRVVVLEPSSSQEHPAKAQWFDGAWHDTDAPFGGDCFGFMRVVDLSDGALVALAEHVEGPGAALLLERGTTRWTPIASHPSFDARQALTGPDGKIVIVTASGAQLWDPRRSTADGIAPPPLRFGSSIASLDERHVLVVGGQADASETNPWFPLNVAVAAAWLALGPGVLWRMKKRASQDPFAPRATTTTAGVLLGFVLFALVAFAVVVWALFTMIPR